MRYIWSASDDDGGTWRELSPLNGAKLSIGRSRDLEAGQAFYRKVLEQGMVLGGEDFRWLDAKRASPALRCAEILIRCEALCGQRQEYWRGRFSPGSASWDLDSCKLEVKPDPVDRYTCLLDKSREKVNVLQAARVDATIRVIPSLQFGICVTIGFTEVPLTGCDEFFGDGNTPLDPPINEWLAGHAQAETANGTPYQLNIFWRERITTECVGGNPVPPAGSGWVLETNSCASKGTATYVRQASIAWSFGDAVRGTIVDGVPTPPDDGCLYVYIGTYDESVIDPFDPTLGLVPWFVCLSAATPVESDDARTLRSAIEHLLDHAGCDLDGVRSDFFEWDAPGDALGYSPGINYVTGEINDIDHLLLLQKSDAIDPAASNPATIGELTFEEAMTMLAVAFRCLWDIDDRGFLRIEHRSYWRQQVGLDLNDHATAKEMLSWESLGAQAPRTERAVWMEAQSRDFVGKDIVYSGPCVGKDSKEWTPGRFTTDISFVINNEEDISKDGFVLLATRLVSGVYDTIIDNGAITGNLLSNAPLSWANIERDYWQHDRYRPSGMMNGVDTDFEDFLPTIKQAEASVRMCCSLLDYDPSKRVAGALSRRLGVDAEVQSASHSLFTDRLTLVLIYPY